MTAWLAELPLINARYCLEAMEAALESFNARPGVHASTRLVLAELARPTALALIQRSESLVLDACVPYPAETEAHADYGIRLHKELGMGYALAAFDPACSVSGSKGTLRLLGALYRALEHWGLALLWTTLAYRPPEEEYWLILFRLFQIAEARGLLNVRFEDAEAAEPCKTPLALFKRALLFSQANPRRLRQRDMAGAFRLLGALEDLARLGQEPVHDGLAAEFLLDIGGRNPPARTRLRSAEEEDPRFLHTRNLALLLMDMAEASGTPMQYAIDKSALARVARSLGGVEKRKSMRRPETDACWCVGGLPSLMGALSKPLPFMGQKSEALGGKPHPMGLEVLRDEEDWTPNGRFEARILRNESPLSKLINKKRGMLSSDDIWSNDEGAASSQAPVAVVKGTIVNSSARGCCIIWPSLPSARTKVGELLGVWLGQDRGLNFIGAIRWLECGRNGLTLGVELLAPAAELVDVYDGASKPKGRALLLAAVAALRPDPELLALPGTVQVGSVLRLGSDKGVTAYWVREALEATPSFGRYVLMPVQPGLELG